MATNSNKRKIRISKLFAKNNVSDKDQKRHKYDDSNGEISNGSSTLRIVSGTKKKRMIRSIITYSAVFLLILAVVILNILSPTGLVEAVRNKILASGNGTLPVNVYSINPEYLSNYNGVTAILNDSYFELYNSNGKLINAVSHGMSSPNLECSEARYLIFDRERYKISVLNYSGELFNREFNKMIISADIGRNGTYAVVTDSDTYQNVVYVYNKNNENIFTWNSAQYYVTDVAVADNGKKIAVSLINSKDGSFESYLYVLDLKSATPKYRYVFDDVISAITSCGKEYMIINGFDKAYTIPWDGGAESQIDLSGVVRHYDTNVGGLSCVVSGRADNENINKISILNKNGDIISSFDFTSNVIDVSVFNETVTVLSDSNVYFYDLKGKLIKTSPIGTKCKFVATVSDSVALVLDNTKLSIVN